MTTRVRIDDIPSKKYDKELKNGIHYEEIDQKIESETFTAESIFWSTTLHKYLGDYINNYTNTWKDSNEKKRCRDINHILNFIIKRIKEKKPYHTSYDIIPTYINNYADSHFMIWGYVCTRDSKLSTHYDYIENMKKIDDLCEDVIYIKEKISKIHKNDCKEIENYLDQQIPNLKNIYTSSSTNYSDILGYYGFTSFDEIDNIVKDFKSKCQEGTTGASLAGDQGEVPQHSGKNASIIAVTSLSGILSSFFLLYKTTSFGSILNTLIRKKIKFGNNLSDEAYHETLEDISESSHDGAYNILYNSVGDS
ncbi:PIR Superfamily Protein [Plasmodium ovale wallikeri]|uniref:PIR Superfamily Protein n=1 Tax=Plasmodium ovale wallikeri TaxID=864142 RepID=A0A1A9AMY8_PLAOA|nr:PIR Superfamily Protein [Plasmodium ovale wallikeri]SBT58320.1 PIR Superfamily Protein [Plasmodium ovale wallikeri]